ncbi:hypothetical protein DFP72DRAFT_954192 [Ephemerocybe angulata]|uniref:Uncharacterized protein n=1 Tax=Ephemerocybe angulata TaxID=980116 RepID=A0A8H6IHV7_9AGAR|nr:hypothetical protein DFP72DRAFT_954192 [Tulosesus angulatus]
MREAHIRSRTRHGQAPDLCGPYEDCFDLLLKGPDSPKAFLLHTTDSTGTSYTTNLSRSLRYPTSSPGLWISGRRVIAFLGLLLVGALVALAFEDELNSALRGTSELERMGFEYQARNASEEEGFVLGESVIMGQTNSPRADRQGLAATESSNRPPSRRIKQRKLRRYPLIDRSILAKFGGLDTEGRADEDPAEARNFAASRPNIRRWPPTITRIPEGQAQRPASKKSVNLGPTSPPPEICGLKAGRPCRFLFILRMAEQESKARMHFVQAALLARRLDRILVLPNVAKSRIGACYKHPFEAYYDTEALFHAELPGPGYVTQDDFKIWSEYVAYQEKSPIPARLVSIAASTPKEIARASETVALEVGITLEYYPTELARESEYPGCFPSKWNQLGLDDRSIFVALDAQQPFMASQQDFGGTVAVALRTVNRTYSVPVSEPRPGDLQEPLRDGVDERETDVLILNWDLRQPIFPPTASLPSLEYSPQLRRLATELAPSTPYVAIHWRMETVDPDLLEDCAHALVDVLSNLLHDIGHLGRDIQEVWFASDYPHSISPSSGSAKAGQIAKSGTFKTFGPQHESAVGILTAAFDEAGGGDLAHWRLVDIGASLQTQRSSGSEPTDLLQDTGVWGILDKMIVIQADLFVSGSKQCSRQSSFTRQVVETRQGKWKERRNVVTLF